MLRLVAYHNNLGANYTETETYTPDFDIHFHSIYEIYYFVDGDVDYLVEGKQYHLEPHSILLLAPYVLHGVRINSAKTYKRFAIHFNPAMIDPKRSSVLLAPFPDKKKASTNEVYYTNVQNFSIYTFCEALINCREQPFEIAQTLIPIYLESLLAQLTLMCHTLHHSENSFALSKVVSEVTDYINLHLAEKITLDDLSEHFFISKNHLNRLFRKIIGTTVFDYIISKRIGYAQYLLETGFSATEAAIKSGFGDYTSFYRAYKKITGRSPKEDVLTFVANKEALLDAKESNK